jgi:O-antigen/teichoic acid export membrane protein
MARCRTCRCDSILRSVAGVTDLVATPLGPESESLLQRVARWRGLLRVTPFDTSTPEGRSAERYRRVAWSTLFSTIARFVGLGTSFISVPLVAGYLGSERYGMWLTMSALVAALGPLDLGIGLGVLTIVSDAHGRDDREAARRAISTGMAMLSMIASLLFVVFGIAYFLIPWARLFNVTSPEAISEAGPAAAVLVFAFALGLPLSLIGQIQLAHQSGYISSAWAILGNLGSFAVLIALIVLHSSLPLLVAALTCVGLIAAALNGWFLFWRQRPWLRPRLRDVDLRSGRSLLKTGSFFIVLQVAGLAAYQLDNFVIDQVLGAGAVQEYAIPSKLFTLAPTLLSFVLMPLWPAYRESMARGDPAWVKRTLRRSIIIAAVFNIPSSLLLIVAGPFVLQAWVGSAVHPTTLLLVGLGTWTIMNTVNGPFAMLLNGANVIGFQAVCSILMAIANVTISVLLVQRIGVSGAVYGSVISQLVFIMIPETWYMRRVLRRLEAQPAPAEGAS